MSREIELVDENKTARVIYDCLNPDRIYFEHQTRSNMIFDDNEIMMKEYHLSTFKSCGECGSIAVKINCKLLYDILKSYHDTYSDDTPGYKISSVTICYNKLFITIHVSHSNICDNIQLSIPLYSTEIRKDFAMF